MSVSVGKQSVGHRLNHADVAARVKDHGPNHYAGLYNVMKGVTLAGAGLAFVRLFERGFSAPHAALVIVALVGVLLTYYGQSVGLVIVHLRPSILDIALPMLLTVLEFFIVYRPCTPTAGDLPADWFFAFAAWAMAAAAVVGSVAWRLERARYSQSLWPAAREYKRALWWDVVAASALGVTAAAFAAGRYRYGLPCRWDYGFLALAALFLFFGIRSQGKARRRLAQRLELSI